MSSSAQLHAQTPTLSVVDPRGAQVRGISYCRTLAGAAPGVRVVAHEMDVQGRNTAVRDARAVMVGSQPNRTTRFSLSGRVLLTDSSDAGWRVTLYSEALPCEAWDSRGSFFHTEYDDQLRPSALHEQASGEPLRIVERLTYGGVGGDCSARNQCGRLVRHDDPAGVVWIDNYVLAGQPQVQRRRFLDGPYSPDWPARPEEREALLEAGAGYTTEARFNAVGDAVARTDARGNRQWFELDRSGVLRTLKLQLAGEETVRSVRNVDDYDAFGRIVRESAGNGVSTERTYCPRNGQLLRQLARLSGQAALQDLHYTYDPVGNVLSIEDRAQAQRFFRNQRIDARQVMFYDSLYQLVEAHGVEVSPPAYGPGLPPLYELPLDPSKLVNYQQHYEYDASGNLLRRRHSNTAGMRMAVAAAGNHALPERPDGSLPDLQEIAEAYDGCGNLIRLDGLADMAWNPRNQLREVQRVVRQDGSNDREHYLYAADGSRVRKVTEAQAKSRSLQTEVRYLPGLELHHDRATGRTWDVLLADDTLRVTREAGEHWRYSIGDHLGSIALELDEHGDLVSREGFYPFGGTSVWAARNAVQASSKTRRYCGKERDASGLYYFGLRYYAPWLARWTSADPLGEVDGTNLYRMVLNNPVSHRDANGGQAMPTLAHYFWAGSAIPRESLRNVLMFTLLNPDWGVSVITPKPAHLFSTLVAMEDSVDPVERYLARGYGSRINHKNPSEEFDALADVYPHARKLQSIFERESAGAYANFAAASDAMRLAVIHLHGGLYMDVDVAVKTKMELPVQARAGVFMLFSDGYPSNAVMAGSPLSNEGVGLLDALVEIYWSPDWYAEMSWTQKRGGSRWVSARLDLTIQMSGPHMLSGVLGTDSVRSNRDLLPESLFHRRMPVTRGGGLKARSTTELFYSGYRCSVDGSGAWASARPGRRSSIG